MYQARPGDLQTWFADHFLRLRRVKRPTCGKAGRDLIGPTKNSIEEREVRESDGSVQ